MDRPLDDVISERGRRNAGGRGRRRDFYSRDDSRKMNGRNDTSNIDTDWIHDKYEDEPSTRRPVRGPRNVRTDRYSPESEPAPTGARIRVDNLHYDLTEDDLDGLFSEIGPVQSLSLRFDRAGRSSGTAFVSYTHISDARHAIREFDGANANGQPIRLTLLPSGPSGAVSSNGIGIRGRAAPAPRNPFDTAVKPGRSLFERIEEPRGGSRSKGRSRSRSPGAPRRTNISKPPPDGVDRYVPSGNNSRRRSRSRSPVRRRRSPVRGRRGGGGGGGGGGRERGEGERLVNGRPKKTQEELDKEMEDYWGGQKKDEGVNGNGIVQNGHATANGFGGAVFGATTTAADDAGPIAQEVVIDDGDIDMIE